MSNEQPNAWFSLIPRKVTKANIQEHLKRRHSTLDWEFGAEEQAVWEITNAATLPHEPTTRAGQRPDAQGQARAASSRTPLRTSAADVPADATPVIDVARHHTGHEREARRVLATRLALDEALDHWWTNGELPSLTLLRDGLMALEAGHGLDETQRSFLLRVALRRQRGMITALRYQGDPDRTAFLLKDALLDFKYPLPATVIQELQQEDEQSAIWMDYLIHDLQYELGVAQGKRHQLVVKALTQLQGGSHHWLATSNGNIKGQTVPLSYRWSLRWLCWALSLLALGLGYGVLHRTVYAETVRIPAGSYTISDPAGVARMRTVVLGTFHLDQTEVTNGAYQHCYADGACAGPGREDSATRATYFANPVYADFPVVNVDWDAANTYCAWLGKRLPTVEEWEVTASIAPLTQRYFRYPWGDRFEPNFVNGGSIFVTDTRAVGTFHPVGDSSFGARDMAGNVAEWTASPGLDPAADAGTMAGRDIADEFIVKGGSYRDSAELLRLDVQQKLVRTTQAPWLGFRCASD